MNEAEDNTLQMQESEKIRKRRSSNPWPLGHETRALPLLTQDQSSFPFRASFQEFCEIFLNNSPGLYFWNEITIETQSRWVSSFQITDYTTGNRIGILYWNNHYWGIEDVKSTPTSWGSNLRPCTPHFLWRATRLALFFWLFQHPSKVAEY